MRAGDPRDPHAVQPVLTAGPTPASARLTLILVHGRGASADDILALGEELRLDDVACLAPQAAGRTWYPYSFLAPVQQNEPGLTSGFGVLSRIIDGLQQDGVDPAHVALLGFSQGACLMLEYVARHARRYAGVFALSGGLIGPPGTLREYPGSFAGTRVLFGCSDVDPHIPLERVHESADVFRRIGAEVDERIYPGMGHTVNLDEMDAVRDTLQHLT